MNVVCVLTSFWLQAQAYALLIYAFLQAFLGPPPHVWLTSVVWLEEHSQTLARVSASVCLQADCPASASLLPES